ncbi:domain-containing 2B isoform X1 [Podarcis lilfordi]|uniref:Domain-containing 2B isoform X1 n=1 Tax=Podarcis lilfordi TaxID=74358 RepID=A0AA35KQN1_9SAUR|nr:domain-containing 2B isoform X1 [Podarcis lilfordi]
MCKLSKPWNEAARWEPEERQSAEHQEHGWRSLVVNNNFGVSGLQSYPVIPQKMPVSTQWRKQANLPCIIHVFRNGDLLSPPFRLILNKSTLQEWSAVLSILSIKANLRTGAVRRLCKLNGDAVSTGEDLVSGNYYVAVGLEKYKDLPYFELLVPPKITHQPIRDHSNSRRMSHNRGLAKLHLAPLEGSSDSALLEPPQQLNLRRVQSTGIVQESSQNLSAVTRKGRKHLRKEADSIFHAKPGQARRIRRNSNQNSDQDEGSVYKIKGVREEIQNAQEIRDDENTQVELPLDQKAAETVEEEVVPKSEALQRRK